MTFFVDFCLTEQGPYFFTRRADFKPDLKPVVNKINKGTQDA